MPSLREALQATGLGWLDTLNYGPDFSVGRTSDARHSILPESMGIPLRMTNTETMQFLGGALPGLRDYKTAEVGDIPLLIDEEACIIVVHTKGAGTTDNGPYKNEYMWVLKTTDDGRLIQESWEFVDSVAL